MGEVFELVAADDGVEDAEGELLAIGREAVEVAHAVEEALVQR